MKILKSITFVTLLFLAVGVNAQSTKDKKIIKDSENAKEKLMTMEVGLDQFFTNSAGYVIFPNVGKGGFIIGGASGNGVVYENGTMVGMADLKKLSVGLQAGGQAITEVIFFETADDLAEFKDGDFEFSAEASAVALKSGVAVNAKYRDGVAVFALPKAGLMADASVGGQKFDYKPMMK
ncbi:lipid-binding SYLF domain-containing protein [Maribacter sp. 1_MG-2023]|uniref:lipid-binding SYLF domain-containing protein n=1 Tax=Maribacter sp. 1_MG-2023 TaxID=3062677 RepID=UPI0026E316F8|nr:lipid-binding SYLF domain-containing protein [Maribacter sp. 1_MG-2023]MDO6470367.1 lipid-binding SYLF domain-containing protein [Maribacter sp. 1_MG-2023]